MATLFVVATPIGNLEDLSPRAARVLAESPVVAAESVGRAKKLLAHLGLSGKWLISCREANRRQAAAKVLQALGEGKDVALISDAGYAGPQRSGPGGGGTDGQAGIPHKPGGWAQRPGRGPVRGRDKAGALCVPRLFAGPSPGRASALLEQAGANGWSFGGLRGPSPHGRCGQGFGRGLGRAPGGGLPGAEPSCTKRFYAPPAPSWRGAWTRTSSGAR